MTAPATTALVLVTALATFISFQRRELWERWMFKTFYILRLKQYERCVTSGFIHLDWMHFLFNAFSLWSFGSVIEMDYGPLALLAIHGASIIGGSLLSLFVHRHNDDYRALGASGGVCGVIYAYIFLIPGGEVQMFFLPVGIPAYAYAILYLLYTFFALRNRIGNIGHDAHLGGAIMGLITATAIYPQMVLAQPALFAAVMGLSIILLVVLIYDPLQLLKFGRNRKIEYDGSERERRYQSNRDRNEKLAEIDRLLDRVSEKGIHSLSPSERARLDELSREIGGS